MTTTPSESSIRDSDTSVAAPDSLKQLRSLGYLHLRRTNGDAALDPVVRDVRGRSLSVWGFSGLFRLLGLLQLNYGVVGISPTWVLTLV